MIALKGQLKKLVMISSVCAPAGLKMQCSSLFKRKVSPVAYELPPGSVDATACL